MNYRIGDTVTIINNTARHQFKRLEVLKIVDDGTDEYDYMVARFSGRVEDFSILDADLDDWGYVNEADITKGDAIAYLMAVAGLPKKKH